MSLTVPASGEFPVLEREGIAYLDSAATSQTPRSVIEAMDRYYLESRATVHRSTSARSIVPSAPNSTYLRTAPCRSTSHCHGTMLEWCSISVRTMRSPAARFARP